MAPAQRCGGAARLLRYLVRRLQWQLATEQPAAHYPDSLIYRTTANDDRDRRADLDSDADRSADQYRDTDSQCDIHSDAIAAYRYADQHADTDCDPDSDENANLHSDQHGNPYTHVDGNSLTGSTDEHRNADSDR